MGMGARGNVVIGIANEKRAKSSQKRVFFIMFLVFLR